MQFEAGRAELANIVAAMELSVKSNFCLQWKWVY
jgi:hypothetical protein